MHFCLVFGEALVEVEQKLWRPRGSQVVRTSWAGWRLSSKDPRPGGFNVPLVTWGDELLVEVQAFLVIIVSMSITVIIVTVFISISMKTVLIHLISSDSESYFQMSPDSKVRVRLLGAPATGTTTTGLLLPSRRSSASVCPPPRSTTDQRPRGVSAGQSARRTEPGPSPPLVLCLLLTGSFCTHLAPAGGSRDSLLPGATSRVLLLGSGPPCGRRPARRLWRR